MSGDVLQDVVPLAPGCSWCTTGGSRTWLRRRAPPAAVGPKQGVALCRPAQFTLVLVGEFFHHVRLHGPSPPVRSSATGECLGPDDI
ncbi:MAG TPA: hypothetical protein VHO07_04240 [Streptosporangiaceae bacterium]|nr:hypothetical protein [Streptosporangiaceae bacterium]